MPRSLEVARPHDTPRRPRRCRVTALASTVGAVVSVAVRALGRRRRGPRDGLAVRRTVSKPSASTRSAPSPQRTVSRARRRRGRRRCRGRRRPRRRRAGDLVVAAARDDQVVADAALERSAPRPWSACPRRRRRTPSGGRPSVKGRVLAVAEVEPQRGGAGAGAEDLDQAASPLTSPGPHGPMSSAALAVGSRNSISSPAAPDRRACSARTASEEM